MKNMLDTFSIDDTCLQIPDARPLGTFENQDGHDGKTWYI